MKRFTAFLISAAMFVSCAGIVNAAVNDTAGDIVGIRRNINDYTKEIQSENGRLLDMSAEEIGSADFAAYDNSDKIIGSALYDFEGGRIDKLEKITSGAVNSLVNGKYTAKSTIKYGAYSALFYPDTVIRAENGGRAQISADYAEDVPSYQVIKDIKNLYVENIDFKDFPVMKFENCENIIFNNCSFDGFSDNGIVFRDCADISVINCSFTDCGNKMSDSTNSGYSVRIVGDKENPSGNILIENCNFENSCGKTISFAGTVDNYVIRNNTINNSVWGAIDYWKSDVSGKYVNVIENNICTNTGFGKPSVNDMNAEKSGVGCAVIFAGMGSELPRTIVKNNTIINAVETGIEGSYELVYHNTVKNTGERSAVRFTGSTEAVFIKGAVGFEQKYIANTIETRGLRCFSSYSDSDEEYKGIYILNNSMKLKDTDSTITCNYTRSDIEINCKKLKKLVIKGNTGMMTDKPGVYVYIRDNAYTMEHFCIDNPCMIGSAPRIAKNLFSINN